MIWAALRGRSSFRGLSRLAPYWVEQSEDARLIPCADASAAGIIQRGRWIGLYAGASWRALPEAEALSPGARAEPSGLRIRRGQLVRRLQQPQRKPSRRRRRVVNEGGLATVACESRAEPAPDRE